LLRASGVRLEVQGTVRPGPVLFAANHVSWLDIPAVLAVTPMRVVAKDDVRRWPVIGLLAARGGTLFIDRRRLRRLPGTVAPTAAACAGGPGPGPRSPGCAPRASRCWSSLRAARGVAGSRAGSTRRRSRPR